MTDALWSAEDTSPSEIEAALRAMEAERHQEDRAVPARVLNLVTIVDREWRGEVENRLAGVGRYHASRTVLCAVEPGRETLSARVSPSTEIVAWASIVVRRGSTAQTTVREAW